MLNLAHEARLRKEIRNQLKLLIQKTGTNFLSVETLFSIAVEALQTIGVPATMWWNELSWPTATSTPEEEEGEWVIEVELDRSTTPDWEIVFYWDALNAVPKLLDECVVSSRWGHLACNDRDCYDLNYQSYCLYGTNDSTTVRL